MGGGGVRKNINVGFRFEGGMRGKTCIMVWWHTDETVSRREGIVRWVLRYNLASISGVRYICWVKCG